RLAIKFDVEPLGHPADLCAQGRISVDHRHAIDGFVEIFDDWLRPDQRHALVRLDHHRGFARRVQVDELVALLPWVFPHQFMAYAFLGKDQPDLPRKGAKRELEKLPHGGAALAAGCRASSAWDRSDRA